MVLCCRLPQSESSKGTRSLGAWQALCKPYNGYEFARAPALVCGVINGSGYHSAT